MNSIIAESAQSQEEQFPDSVNVKKIKNGFVISAWCGNYEKAEYIKSIAKMPTVIKRFLGLDKMSRKRVEETTQIEENEKKNKDGSVELEIKVSNSEQY